MLTRVAWETRESVRAREVERARPAHRRPYTAPMRSGRPASAQSSYTHLGAGSAVDHALSAPAIGARKSNQVRTSGRGRPKTAVSFVPAGTSDSSTATTPITISFDSDDDLHPSENADIANERIDASSDSDTDDTDDTDVENADIEKEETLSVDSNTPDEIPLGVQMYRDACKKAGCVPARYYERQGNADAVFAMNGYGLGAAGVKALSEDLENNDQIKHLALNGNGIRGKGVRHVTAMLASNRYIEHVQLAGNALKSDGMHAMAQFFSRGDSRLQTLNLSDNKILDMDLSAFSSALCDDTRLQKLDLSRNFLGDKAATDLGRTLQTNSTISHLDLSHNRILHRGASAVADALHNNDSLQTLHLAHNGIGSAGVAALAGALEGNNTLTSLDVSWNNIHDDGAAALAHVLRTRTTLIQVNLAHNPISEDGTRMLLEALRGNAGLLEINLEGLPLRREDSSLLTDIQAQCPDVKIFRGTAARDANRLQGLRRRASVVEMELEERRQSLVAQQALDALRGDTDDANANLHDGSAGTSDADGRNGSNSDWSLGGANGRYGGGGRMLRGNTRSGLPPQLSRSAQAQRSDDSDEGIRRSRRMRSSMVIDADDLAGFDSDDEQAEYMRNWAERHPDLHDPMLVLEQYVYQNQLRLIDFFFAIDKDRSGGVTWEELQNAVQSLPGLQLNEEQQDELMHRLDVDRDGLIKYDELCEGRRIVYERLRSRDPRWRNRDNSDDDSDDDGSDDEE